MQGEDCWKVDFEQVTEEVDRLRVLSGEALWFLVWEQLGWPSRENAPRGAEWAPDCGGERRQGIEK
jgi:hypothetical protein